MYVLVTIVGGELDVPGGPFPIGNDDPVGIYRLERDGSFTVIADIGAWSVANPPSGFNFFIDTGVQYAIQAVRDGFLVTDGHHNRVLRVSKQGEISEHVALGNIVPTGLEVAGNTIYTGLLGPIPQPEDGKVVTFGFRNPTATEVASGAAMIVDVEMGRGQRLFALSQGEWDGVGEGSPASENTGRLVEVQSDGTMTPVVDGNGDEIVLDRPTSLEFVGNTAYVISLSGAITRIDNVADPSYGK